MDKSECKHESHHAHFDVVFLEDVKQWAVTIKLLCVGCNEFFHFIAPDHGIRWDRPTLNFDSTELHCPLAPPGTLITVPTRMAYHVPGKPQES
jgi:hypothetical protein